MDCCAVGQAAGLSGPYALTLSLVRRTIVLSVRQPVLVSQTHSLTHTFTLCETLRREAVHQTAGPVLGHLRDFGTILPVTYACDCVEYIRTSIIDLHKVLREDHRVSLIIH